MDRKLWRANAESTWHIRFKLFKALLSGWINCCKLLDIIKVVINWINKLLAFLIPNFTLYLQFG